MKLELVNLIDMEAASAEARGRNNRLVCKFVMVSQNGTMNMVMGLVAEYPYHANLVDRFCLENQIASSWVKKPDLVEVYDSEVDIRGGGWIDINLEREILTISGYSTAYGCYEPDEIRQFTAAHSFFSDYEVSVAE